MAGKQGDHLRGKPALNPKGRTPGPNEKTKMVQEILTSPEILAKIENGAALGPLARAFYMLQDDRLEEKLRIELIKILLPYTDKKKPVDTNMNLSQSEPAPNLRELYKQLGNE